MSTVIDDSVPFIDPDITVVMVILNQLCIDDVTSSKDGSAPSMNISIHRVSVAASNVLVMALALLGSSRHRVKRPLHGAL